MENLSNISILECTNNDTANHMQCWTNSSIYMYTQSDDFQASDYENVHYQLYKNMILIDTMIQIYSIYNHYRGLQG